MSDVSPKVAVFGSNTMYRLVLTPGDTGTIVLDSTKTSPATVTVANLSPTTGNVSGSITTVTPCDLLGSFDPIRIALGVSDDGTVGPADALTVALPSRVRSLVFSHAANADGNAVIEVLE